MQAHHALNGQDAIELVRSRFQQAGLTYRLIITDLFMPICSGLDAAEQIRAYYRSEISAELCEEPYICMLTCNESESCKKKAYAAGINEVIKKPIFKAGVQRLLINAGMIKV